MQAKVQCHNSFYKFNKIELKNYKHCMLINSLLLLQKQINETLIHVEPL